MCQWRNKNQRINPWIEGREGLFWHQFGTAYCAGPWHIWLWQRGMNWVLSLGHPLFPGVCVSFLLMCFCFVNVETWRTIVFCRGREERWVCACTRFGFSYKYTWQVHEGSNRKYWDFNFRVLIWKTSFLMDRE